MTIRNSAGLILVLLWAADAAMGTGVFWAHDLRHHLGSQVAQAGPDPIGPTGLLGGLSEPLVHGFGRLLGLAEQIHLLG